jgi:hypothetical protein
VAGEGVSLTVNGREAEIPLTGYQHF